MCMCIEACCCMECMVSSTRMLVMDSLDITPDPCDNRIIRFNNCLQLVSCVCNILAMFEPSFRDLAALLDLIADCVFMATVGCMTAQTNYELTNNQRQANYNRAAPRDWYKKGGGSGFSGGGGGGMAVSPSAPAGNQMQRGAPQVHPQPMMQMQMAPIGMAPGQMFNVQHPHTGQPMMVQIPANV